MEQLSSVASIFIAVVIFGEFIYRLFVNKSAYDKKDTLINVFIGISGSALSKVLWHGLMFGGFTLCYQFSLINHELNPWIYWTAALLLSDFSYYWYHRLGHEIRLFWGTHSVHHSSEDYNLSTAVRLSWLENSFRWIFWIPLPLLGFSPVNSMIAYLIIRYYQVWLHSEEIKKVPVFEKIFTTPSHHRVHHGTNPQYIDKNYAGCLIIWDKIFGTFELEKEPVVYGVLKPIETYNPVSINFKEYWNLAKDVWNEPSFKNKFLYLIKKPGWNPSGESISEAELFEQKLAMGFGRQS